ncbi:MAG: hypothetical protein ACOYIE_06205 [Agathobaculum sp.]|jgi:hypothetical protein|uniref:hypothetical protein n=1 Tax=Agathobaculum sp. TaxID=2048138 RepID=UPI003D90969C
MKKKVIIAAVAIVCAVAAGLFVFRGQRPYRDLKASHVVSAAVRLSPPDQTIPIAEADMEELVSYLNEVVIYNEDQSYTEYAGQAAIFTLQMADGTREEIAAYNPFVVINGTGYRTKYEPCEKLNRYANKLLNRAK